MSKDKIPQRKLGTALRSFFDHVTSHDEEGVHAALCMVANATEEESPTEVNGVHVLPMHICSFSAGDPNALAQIMVMAIDNLIKETPGFEEAWTTALRAKRLQTMISQVMDVVQQAAEVKGMEAAKPAVDALIEKLKGNPGAVPGPDTKQ